MKYKQKEHYLVEIEETLSRTVKVAARSPEEAATIVEMAYDRRDIVLDTGDFVAKSFTVREVSSEDLDSYREVK